MARKKKEELTEEVNEQELVNESIEEVVEELVTDEELVPTIASIDLADSEDTTVTSYVRKTPFGTEVWDPIKKRTVLVDG